MKRRKNNKYLLLLILLLVVTIGYAALSTTLKIIGTANVSKPSWNIYWTNPVVSAGSVSQAVPNITEDQDDPENTKVVWTVNLSLPGDYYEFTVDAVNNGTVDAMITNIESIVYDSNNTPTSLPDYIVYTVKYNDGTSVDLNQSLESNQSKKYKVRVYYDFNKMTVDDINDMPQGGLSYTFSYKVTYSVQTDQVIKPNLRLGEYFTLTADQENATTTYAGFSGSTPTADQDLWRVINVNDDGTVDAVSHYVSTNDITITGDDGYKNLVAGLNDIASCYAKSGYTVKTRMFGYDGQTPVIKDTYYFNGSSYATPSVEDTPMPKSGTGEEYDGGVLGDTLYLKDYLLVKAAYNNSLAAKKKGINVDISYWVTCRQYEYRDENYFIFGGLNISSAYSNDLRFSELRRFSSGSWYNYINKKNAVRPIITLRSGLVKNGGEGSETNPYTFE